MSFNLILSTIGALLVGGPSGTPTLLAFIDKYGILISQWTWVYHALLEVSINKIVLWIYVCADDWTAERAIIASNEHEFILTKRESSLNV